MAKKIIPIEDIRFISIEDVYKEYVLKGKFSKYAPFYLLAKELNLKVLMRYKDEYFFGPPPDLAEILDVLTRAFKIKTVLDLFSGSGALAKVALINGVEKAVCVDLITKAIKINLSEFKNRTKIIEGDIFEMEFDDFYDIAILDPEEEMLIDVCETVLPKLKADLIIMWYGSHGDTRTEKKVETLCRKLFDQTHIIEIHGSKDICCSSTKKGKEYMDFERKFGRTPEPT